MGGRDANQANPALWQAWLEGLPLISPAAGDLGMAMGAAGSEAAIQSATIALMNNNLGRPPFLVELWRAARRVINQNFLLGVAFAVGGVVLGAMRFLSPVAAALFHVAGSLLGVFNSFRLMRLPEALHRL